MERPSVRHRDQCLLVVTSLFASGALDIRLVFWPAVVVLLLLFVALLLLVGVFVVMALLTSPWTASCGRAASGTSTTTLLQKSSTERYRLPRGDAALDKQVPCHTSRHFFMTHLMERGHAIAIVQTLLDRGDVATTIIYTTSSATAACRP